MLKGGSSFFWELQSALINLCSHRRTGTALFQFSFDFVRVKSYEGTESTGKIQITGTDLANLKGRHLLLVEDLIDSGLTMYVAVFVCLYVVVYIGPLVCGE